MRFQKAPTREEAIELLQWMAAQPVSCRPVTVDKPLVLYGAGDLGRMAKAYFDRIGIKIEYVVDKYADTRRTDACWAGVPILFPNQVAEKHRKTHLLAVCVVTTPYVPILEELQTQGWVHVASFYDIAEAYRDRHPLSNGWFASPLTSVDIERIGEVLRRWEDDVSRAHHLQFIAWHLLRQEISFEDSPVNIGNRYFIPEVRDVLTDHESFSDIGAHIGSASLRFMQTTNGRFRQLWAVEPDSENLRQLRSQFAALDQENIGKVKVIAAVVGRVDETRRFCDGLGYASQLTDLGTMQVEATTIDRMGMSPTFIKLHLEGAELEALEGAEGTIRSCRPIIAATSYHNKDGLWTMPNWLMRRLDDYRILMRLHSWCGTGAVIYCIPKKGINGRGLTS